MWCWVHQHWRDLLDVAGVLATVFAALLAAAAVWQASRQAKRSAQAVARERRIDFELDQLGHLSAVLMSGPGAAWDANGKRYLAMLPEGELPRLRALFRVSSEPSYVDEAERIFQRQVTDPGPGLFGHLTDDGTPYGVALSEEVRLAVMRRINERG